MKNKLELRFARRSFFIKQMKPIDEIGFPYVTFLETEAPVKTEKGFKFGISTMPHHDELEVEAFQAKYVQGECVSYRFDLRDPEVRRYFELDDKR